MPVKTKTAGDVVANINNGTVTSVTNLAAGTVTKVEGGTIQANVLTGTINVGTFTNLGTNVNVVTGTQQTLGTVGIVNALVVGTIGGKAASGAAAVANPVLIAGTDSGGTVYAPIVTSTGAMSVSGASAGTYVNIVTGTQQTLGTVGVVNSQVAGTLNTLGTVAVVNAIVAGTQNTLGTVGTLAGQGTLTNLGSLTNAGTVKEITNIAGGTVTVSNYPGAASPQFSYQTASALAAGALGTLQFGTITNAKTGQLAKVIVSSSVPIRAEIQKKADAGAIGTAGVVFTSAANPSFDFNAPADTYFTQASTGTAWFRAVITNMDNALAADIYSTAFWDEI